MFIYLAISIIILTLLLSIFVNFIHLSQYKFKKYLKLFIFICLILFLIFLMRFNPNIISVIPLVFVLFFKWMPVLTFLKNIFFNKKTQSVNFKKMDKDEALEILGLDRKATKDEIIERYNKLIKKNHPDLGGSEWITKRINKARDILLG